jgi:tetratricopeptide (TPR) repeat protein
VLLAGRVDLQRSLYELDALIAKSPGNVEARLLRLRISGAIAAAGEGRLAQGGVRGTEMDERTWLVSPKAALRPPVPESAPAAAAIGAAGAQRAKTLAMPPTGGGPPGRPSVRSPPSAAPARPLSLPAGQPVTLGRFVGRERMLLDLSNRMGPAGLLLCGLAGMGKRALTRALRRALRFDRQITLDLQGTTDRPLPPTAAMAQVVRALRTGMLPAESPREIAGLYHAALREQPALIVLEDARDAAAVEPLLPPEGSVLLITSRRRFTLPGVRVVSVDALEAGEAGALLRTVVPSLDDAPARAIAEGCGGVPLALRLAGAALLHRPDLTPQGYLDRLDDAMSRHEQLDATFEVSFGMLDPVLQTVWSHLGVFGGSFHLTDAHAMGGAHSHFLASSAVGDHALGLPVDPGEMILQALGDLVAYGMVEEGVETGVYRLPRAGRQVALSHLSGADRSAYLDRIAARTSDAALTEEALAAHRERGDREGERRALRALFALHRDRGEHESAVEVGEELLVLLRADEHAAEDASLLEATASLHEQAGNDRRAVALLERRLALPVEKRRRSDHARCARHLSDIHRRLGDLDQAVAALETCVAVTRTIDASVAALLQDDLDALRAARATPGA